MSAKRASKQNPITLGGAALHASRVAALSERAHHIRASVGLIGMQQEVQASLGELEKPDLTMERRAELLFYISELTVYIRNTAREVVDSHLDETLYRTTFREKIN